MAGNLTAMIASIFSGSAVTPDPYYEYTTLLLPGSGTNGAQNNTFLDGSTNNFTITRNGNTTQGTFSPFSQTGWGNYFSGSSQYLSFTDTSNNLDLGGSQASFECWVYPISTTNYQILFKYGGVADWNTTNGIEYGLSVQSGVVYFYYNSSGNPLNINSGATTVSANTWTHIAVASNASNALSLYVNGTRVATTTAAITKPTTRTSVRIGVDAASYANGYMSNYRFITGSNAYDATLSSIPVPTSPVSAVTGTQLLTCQSNRFRDASSNNFTLTVNGSPSVQAFSPFNPTASWSAATNGGSGYFDGNGDYLTVPANAAFTLTGDFCVEFWVYSGLLAGGATNPTFINDSAGSNSSIFYETNGSNRGLCLYAAGAARITTATNVLVENQWNHVAIVRSGTTGTNTAAFVNGTRVGTATAFTGTVDFSPPVINRYGPSAAGYLNGYMSNFRIVKGSSVYDPTSSTITVPTAPLTNITNTSLLLNFTNGGIYDATSKNDLETVGNAQISTTQSKWGGSSMYFDGTGDWLAVPTSVLPQFGTGDFTIEFWWYPNSLATAQQIISNTNDSAVTGSGEFVITYNTSLGLRFYINAGAVDIQQGSTTGWTTGQWYYVAAVRSGNTLTLYRNGSSIASGSVTGITIGANVPFYIGGEPTQPTSINGYLQDVRITKGYARTVTTSPTAAFPTL